MEALDLEEEPAEDGAFYGAPYFVNDAANFVPRSEADAYRGDDDGEVLLGLSPPLGPKGPKFK